MHYIDSARTFFRTFVILSIALCFSPAVARSQAATTPSAAGKSLLLTLGTPREPMRSSGLTDSDTRSTGDVIVSADQGVYVYSNTLKPLVQIGAQNLPGRPAGLALDASGDLYVANYGNSIPVYKNDYKTVIATLSAPNGAQGIAVAQNGVVGTVIGNQVTFYASGSTTPCASLSLPKVHQLYQGAFDAAANFYVTGQDSNYNGIVGVISGGCSATSFTLLSTSNSLGQFVYGIQVTRFGKIAIGDQGSNAIYEYDPPVNGALGQPVATTDLPSSTKAIYEFGFTAKGAFVFVASDSGIVAKCAYPSGGKLLQSVGQQQQLDNPTGLVVAAPG